MNLCPSYIHLRAAKHSKKAAPKNHKGILYPEKYDLIDDEKTARLKAVRANTPNPVSIRLFVCQNRKGLPRNYCGEISDSAAEKKICESNKTDYVFFYVNKSEQEHSGNKPKEEPVYMVAFARYSADKETARKIVAEIKRTAEWLGIAGSVTQCYVFYYTSNSLCNTFNWGSFKEKHDRQCGDPKYFFQFQYIFQNEKPRCLCVNGGSPAFTIMIQEM